MLRAGKRNENGDAHGMSQSVKAYCVRYNRRELLAQWYLDKNSSLTPDEITSGSHRAVWWKCGCPVCAGKMPRIYLEDKKVSIN
jgi:hypothetical protein